MSPGGPCVKEQASDNRERWGLGSTESQQCANPTFQESSVLSESSCRWNRALGTTLQSAGAPLVFSRWGQSCVLGLVWRSSAPVLESTVSTCQLQEDGSLSSDLHSCHTRHGVFGVDQTHTGFSRNASTFNIK